MSSVRGPCDPVNIPRSCDTTPQGWAPLAVGALAFDTVTGAIGVVMAEYGTRYYLRPPHGGCEWDAPRTDIRPATVTDRIRPALNEANTRSSTGGVL